MLCLLALIPHSPPLSGGSWSELSPAASRTAADAEGWSSSRKGNSSISITVLTRLYGSQRWHKSGGARWRMRTRILPKSRTPPAIPAIPVFSLQALRPRRLAGPHPAQRDKGNATPLIRKFKTFPWIYQLPKFPGL